MRVLLSGCVVKTESKTTASGNSYAKATVKVDAQQRSESDPTQQIVWCVAFNDCATALLAMQPGDPIALAGKLSVTANLHQDRPQAALNVVIDKIIDAKRPPRPERKEQLKADIASRAHRHDAGDVASLVDDIPF